MQMLIPYWEILSIILVILYVCLIAFYITGWKRLNLYHNSSGKTVSTPVSVIIPARNEEHNIGNCLQDIIAQNFPKMLLEIIVVDDNSTDKTLQKASEIIDTYKNEYVITLISLENEFGNAGKKRAVEKAVALASGKLIITTDADCRMDKNWLFTLVSYYEQFLPKMISGPVSYTNERNFFEKLQTLEFLSLIGSGAASLGHKLPLMCNGANLAYEKQVFTDINRYNHSLASGDDVFLMLNIARHYPGAIHFLKAPEAIVYTSAKQTFAGFMAQRKRWTSKTKKYKNRYLIAIALLIYAFNFSILANALMAFYSGFFLKLVAIQMTGKLLIDFLFLFRICSFFNRKALLFLILPEEIIYSLYITIIGTIAPFGRYSWKGRSVK